MKNFCSISIQILSLSLIFFFQANGNDSLGWKGTPVIATADFANPANWHANSSSGDVCMVNADPTDSSTIQLHWKFNPGTGHRYAQIFLILNNLVSLSNMDVIGLDIKGQHIDTDCGEFNIQMKFENTVSTSNATCQFSNMARMERWCENISMIKNQFSNKSFNWEQVKVVSLEVFTDLVLNSSVEGVVSFRNLAFDSFSNWGRASKLTTINNSYEELEKINKAVLDTITSRQTSTGLLTTWNEDGSSWLYGQGLALKALSLNGSWKAQSGDSVRYRDAAIQLAAFLINHQDAMGFWPRTWRSKTGDVIVNLEDDGSVWFGDFPWIIIGLQNYFKKSGDITVLPAIEKAKHFLTDSLINPDGKLYTIKKSGANFKKQEVTSVEAYAAVILSLLEIGETEKAVALATYIDSKTWDNTLRYWKESMGGSRVVLFANTWFSQLIINNPCIAGAVDPTLQKSKDALSLVGKVLFTRGPGIPVGFDGIGPVATWLEGTLSYICAGGPGSQTVFDSLINYIEPGYGVLHYNDKVSCGIGGIWAEKWVSLDGTSWLFFAASKSSPFKIETDAVIVYPDNSKTFGDRSFHFFPNPSAGVFTLYGLDDLNSKFEVFNFQGRLVKSGMFNSGFANIDLSEQENGMYLIHSGSDFVKVILMK
jgi:hypothetical protein